MMKRRNKRNNTTIITPDTTGHVQSQSMQETEDKQAARRNRIVPLNRSEQLQFLEKAGDQIRDELLKADKLFLLFLNQPEATHQKIEKAWALYHCVQTSLRFGEAHRAARYLLAFCRFCEESFSSE